MRAAGDPHPDPPPFRGRGAAFIKPAEILGIAKRCPSAASPPPTFSRRSFPSRRRISTGPGARSRNIRKAAPPLRCCRCCGGPRSRPAAGCRKRRSNASPSCSAWRRSACSRSRPSTPCSCSSRSAARPMCSGAAPRRACCAAAKRSRRFASGASITSRFMSPPTAISPGRRSSALAPASMPRWS